MIARPNNEDLDKIEKLYVKMDNEDIYAIGYTPGKFFQDIREITAKKLFLKEEEISLESEFSKDLGADSLDLVELVICFEELYDVKIEDGDGPKLKTVEDAVDVIIDLFKKKAAALPKPEPNSRMKAGEDIRFRQ